MNIMLDTINGCNLSFINYTKLVNFFEKMDGSADINQTIVLSLQFGFQLSGGSLHGNTLLFEDSSFPTSYVSECIISCNFQHNPHTI